MVFTNTLPFASGGRSNYRIPSIVADRHGTFYAFCNDRKDTLSDAAGEVSLVLSRKKPGGEWEVPRALLSVPGWACSMGSAVYDPETDTVMCCGEKIPIQRHEFGNYTIEQLDEMRAAAERLAKETGIRMGRVLLLSEDGGDTWEETPHVIEPAEIVGEDGTTTLLGGSCHGSAHGIRLRHGPHAGRLLCPSRTQLRPYSTWEELKTCACNNALFSDDHGATWHASRPVQIGTGEGALLENADGSITYNSRAYFRDRKRYLATSRDGGETWGDFRTDTFLSEERACGCNASWLRVEREELREAAALLPASADGVILFANPRSEKRENMTVCASLDGGTSWKTKTVYPGPSAYSSLDWSRETGRFALLYERGKEDPCDGGIAAAEFDLEWILEK